MALLTAAQQALSNASVTDFVIVEYLPDIGGRVSHTTFGRKRDGTPYVVELGANWVRTTHVSRKSLGHIFAHGMPSSRCRDWERPRARRTLSGHWFVRFEGS